MLILLKDQDRGIIKEIEVVSAFKIKADSIPARFELSELKGGGFKLLWTSNLIEETKDVAAIEIVRDL